MSIFGNRGGQKGALPLAAGSDKPEASGQGGAVNTKQFQELKTMFEKKLDVRRSRRPPRARLRAADEPASARVAAGDGALLRCRPPDGREAPEGQLGESRQGDSARREC